MRSRLDRAADLSPRSAGAAPTRFDGYPRPSETLIPGGDGSTASAWRSHE